MSDAFAPAAPAAANPSTDSAEGQTAEGQEPKQQVAPKKKAPSYRKYQVGNEEVNLSDEDISREYSKWKGGDKALREANQGKQSVEAFMKALIENPEEVLNDPRISFDRKKLAEKWLVKQIEAELNPPDPRDAKLSAAEKRLKEFEERDANEVKSKEETAYKAELENRKTAISQTLSEAMQATQLSAHPESAAAVLREMALYMRAAKERGEEVSPDELVEHVHNSRFKQMYTLANQFEGEELIEFLGEEVVKRLRKADLARLKAGRDNGQSHKSESAWSGSSRPKSGAKEDAMDAKRRISRQLLGK
jgi:hypothetical protein